MTGRKATAFMKYHKGNPLTESRKRDPFKGGFLMILQVAKRIANIRFTSQNTLTDIRICETDACRNCDCEVKYNHIKTENNS